MALNDFFFEYQAVHEQEQERSPGYILPTPLQFIYTTRRKMLGSVAIGNQRIQSLKRKK